MNIRIGYMGKLGIEPISPRKKALYPLPKFNVFAQNESLFMKKVF